MDFGTIAGRVNAHAYPTYEGFVTDVGLMRYLWEQVSCPACHECSRQGPQRPLLGWPRDCTDVPVTSYGKRWA